MEIEKIGQILACIREELKASNESINSLKSRLSELFRQFRAEPQNQRDIYEECERIFGEIHEISVGAMLLVSNRIKESQSEFADEPDAGKILEEVGERILAEIRKELSGFNDAVLRCRRVVLKANF